MLAGARSLLPPRRMLWGKTSAAAPASTDPYIQALWDSADQPRLAEMYLASRGLNLRPKPMPAALRGHGSIKCTETGKSSPAVLAAIRSGRDGILTGLQRVWVERSYIADRHIAPKGSRAPLEVPKKTLGRCLDGAIRLFDAAPEMGLTGGFEDALAVWLMYRIPCWAATGEGRMTRVWIPPTVKRLMLFGDNDGPGRAALRTAADRFRNQCRTEIALPSRGKDFCEELTSWL